jgi:hypothetical protein
MTDRTATERIKRQRDARMREGWQEVRVWVPTDHDAEDVRALAAERRARAEALHGLREGIPTMNPATEERIIAAIADQGSAAYTTLSGPVLTLLTQLAEEGDVAGFSHAFVTFARAKPMNAAFVAEAAPAKVLNGYLFKRLKLDMDAFLRWEKSNPDWAASIKAALRDPAQFEHVVGEMAAAISSTGG